MVLKQVPESEQSEMGSGGEIFHYTFDLVQHYMTYDEVRDSKCFAIQPLRQPVIGCLIQNVITLLHPFVSFYS